MSRSADILQHHSPMPTHVWEAEQKAARNWSFAAAESVRPANYANK